MKYFSILCFNIVLLFMICSKIDGNTYNDKGGRYFRLSNLKIKAGDNSVWKNPGFDDSAWQRFDNTFGKNRIFGNWWIRTRIKLEDTLSYNNILSLQGIRLFSAYQIYWDGKLLARNGIVGNSVKEEEPGIFRFPIYIPPDLSTKGTHTLAIRISNYHATSNLNAGKILFGSYFDWSKYLFTWLTKFYFIIGILFITFVFNVLLFFFSDKKIPSLLFSILCITVALNAFINYYWLIHDVKSTYVDYQDIWNPITTVLIGILIPAYFIYQYKLPNKLLLSGILLFNLIFLIVDINYFQRNNYVLWSIAATSSIILIWAVIQKRKGSLITLIFFLLALVFVYYKLDYDLEDLATLSTIIIIGFDINLAREIAGGERKIKQAEIKSARLEIELLKKNINPHFLMNSLNSIMVYLRRDPEKAIKLVTALANEFKIISDISSLKLIPIKEEIEICKSHLEILNYRKGSEFKLNLINIREEELIPPMIFHTLIENGLTHGYEERTSGYFELKREEIPKGICYTLFNDSNSSNSSEVKMGTGINYVKARLEESYSGKYNLKFGLVENGWTVTITLYK